jgi:1,4-alpha-glucan branching enzyme
MGEEWSASAPFLFFCDFGPDLGPLVTEGRRREFAQFPRVRDPATREQIPDPLDVATVRRSVLDWTELARPAHRARQEWTRRLLRLRQQEIVPLLDGRLVRAEARRMGEAGLTVDWAWTGGRTLRLLANLSPAALDTSLADGGGRCLFATTPADATRREVSGWHTSYYLSE